MSFEGISGIFNPNKKTVASSTILRKSWRRSGGFDARQTEEKPRILVGFDKDHKLVVWSTDLDKVWAMLDNKQIAKAKFWHQGLVLEPSKEV